MSQDQLQAPIKYGDVFPVSGNLAAQAIAPQDAAMMQSAEASVLGQTQKKGTAAVMQAAATANEKAGVVGHLDISPLAGDEGVTVMETHVPGSRILTESVAGQVVGEYVQVQPTPAQNAAPLQAAVTIGEALEVCASTAGDKAMDQSQTAAIQAAECRATGSNIISPGGLSATAQSAAAYNEGLIGGDAGKVKVADVVTGATEKLVADKPVTVEDAERIASAEKRNDPEMKLHAGGVAVALAAAARVNERVA